MTALRDELRRVLRSLADPARAPAMQAYMKSTMPFLGVAATPLRAACRAAFRGLTFRDRGAWEREVLGLFRRATHREERYAAVELSGVRAAAPFQTMESLPLYEELVVTGAWWDVVDVIAAHRLDRLLVAEPRPMKKAMLAWSRSDDPWKRRSAILCQLSRKAETDLDLLYRAIEPALSSREFFLRKAIGWALRQYARTDPAEVKRYVAAQGDRLSPLSRREAMKHL